MNFWKDSYGYRLVIVIDNVYYSKGFRVKGKRKGYILIRFREVRGWFLSLVLFRLYNMYFF